MISPVPRTDRRGALRCLAAAAVVVPTLAACDATDTTPRRSTGLEPTADAASADAVLVAAITPRIAGLRVAATSLAKHAPASRAWALDLAALHQRHLAKLGGAAGRAPSIGVRTPTALVSAEEGLQKALVTAADRAESGALAQVLASMAAAVEQRLVAR